MTYTMKELNATFNLTYFSNYTRERLKRAAQEMKIVKSDCINNTRTKYFCFKLFCRQRTDVFSLKHVSSPCRKESGTKQERDLSFEGFRGLAVSRSFLPRPRSHVTAIASVCWIHIHSCRYTGNQLSLFYICVATS